MRSARLVGPGRVEMTTVSRPVAGAGQVVVDIEGCGVCGSNLPVWEGRPWFEYPLDAGAPGHEAWGRIDDLGDDVPDLTLGQRVAVVSGHAFAEAAVVAAADVVPLPDGLTGAFPGEAIGCAFNAAARSGFAPGQTVAVVGIGFLGAILTALAVDAGARVVAISRRPFSLDVARAMGASETVLIDDLDRVVRRVEDLTDGALCQVVVEAVGTQAPLDLAGRLTGVRGRLVIVGYHQDSPRSVDMQLWNWRGIDVVNAHERDPAVIREGIRLAAEAVAGGRLDPRPLYTHRFPLDRLGAALGALGERPDGFLKALVTT